MKKKINLGQICLFDSNNILRLKEKSIFSVKVVGINKTGLFKKPTYNCINLSTGKPFLNVDERLLLPVEEYEFEDIHIQIRYPNDMPSLTAGDIKTINDIIDIMPSNGGDLVTRLNILKTKLEYYEGINNI